MFLAPAKEDLKVMASVRVSVFPESTTLEPAPLRTHWLFWMEEELPRAMGPNQPVLESFSRYKLEPTYWSRQAALEPFDWLKRMKSLWRSDAPAVSEKMKTNV